jgi:hypothetical protein
MKLVLDEINYISNHIIYISTSHLTYRFKTCFQLPGQSSRMSAGKMACSDSFRLAMIVRVCAAGTPDDTRAATSRRHSRCIVGKACDTKTVLHET